MRIGKRASRITTLTLLSLVAITAVIAAQVRARLVQDDKLIPKSVQVRTTAQGTVRTEAAAPAAATVQPAHAVSRSAASPAPDTRGVISVIPDTAAIEGLNTAVEEPKVYTALEKAYYATANEIAFYRLGLKFTIVDITIPSDRRPVVTYKITDDAGRPLDRDGVLTPGAVSTSFILAYLPASTKGEVTDYVAYTTRTTAVSPITGKTAVQAGADSGGATTPSGQLDGIYTYRFGTTLPSNYNAALTHTLGMYGRRDMREFGFSFYASNPIKNFKPNGSAVTQTHQVVLTSSCNQCHDPLALHGETGRREVEICILCHSPQTVDPDSGNTVDMKVMTHKIHMGKTLPSVVAGGPHYIIYGNSMSVNDYSEIGYPQDIRNCETCHKGAPQVNAYLLQPTIEACGSCHDDVNFATGANHVAGAYANNNECATCHRPTGDYEYDASVDYAHTVPYKSNQLSYPKLTIIGITNTAPGQNPIVSFAIRDKNGAFMDPARFGGSLGRFSANLAGPTTDYTTRITETISGATSIGAGAYSYTFKTIKIPTTATGTWAMEFEGRLTATIIKGGNPSDTITQRDAMDNVVKYFAVTGTTVTPRRTSVSLTNCNKCHEKLQLHGSNRNQIEACVVCHNPTLLANSQPTGTQESVSMQVMVHKIHKGEELENDYILGSTNFKEVLYPGDKERFNCLACHVSNSAVTIPLAAGVQPVVTPKNYWNPTQPIAAACLACHDGVSTAAHAFLNTTSFGGSTITVESCPVCHREGADFAVIKSHAR